MLKNRIVVAVQRDERVMALLDYGSESEGRADEWSDLDLTLFIRDEDFVEFTADWKVWAARFGELLLAYRGGVGHPWTVYAADPWPVRVDFSLKRLSERSVIGSWPNAPLSVAHMVLVDKTDRLFAEVVAPLVGQSQGPADLMAAFQQVCGDFWYYQLRSAAKIKRDGWWEARFDFNFIVTGNLLALLRIEAGEVAYWRNRGAAAGIEEAISAERLGRLNRLVSLGTNADLLRVYRESITLGQDVCDQIAQKHRWEWPSPLAAEVWQIYDGLG